MTALGSLENVKREYLVEAVAILKSTNLINTQIHMLSGIAEKGLNVGKDILSAGLKAIGGWATDMKKQEGVLGELGKVLSPLKETGEKWEKDQIKFSKDLKKKFEEEKAMADKLTDQGLREVFLMELTKVSEFKDDDEKQEDLSEYLFLEMARLYDISYQTLPMEEVGRRILESFIKELLKNLRGGISKIEEKDEESLSIAVLKELDGLADDKKSFIKEAFGVDSMEYAPLKKAILTKFDVEKDEFDFDATSYGVYLASIAFMNGLSKLSGDTSPFASVTVMTSFLAFLISPLGGLLIASGVFAFFEWQSSRNFNRRMFTYIIVPIWLDEKFGGAITALPGE